MDSPITVRKQEEHLPFFVYRHNHKGLDDPYIPTYAKYSIHSPTIIVPDNIVFESNLKT